MNEGMLAIGIILTTIAVAIFAAFNRDLMFPQSNVRTPAQRRPAQLRRPPGARPSRPAPAQPTEIVAKPAAIVSAPVSGIATPNDDAEMIAARTLAKLIRAKAITETVAIETAFDVRAGNGKAYKSAQAKLKIALAEIDSRN